MQRYDADRAKWAEERAGLQASCEERVRAAEAAHAVALDEVRLGRGALGAALAWLQPSQHACAAATWPCIVQY